ncbi:hypothetical protein, partial [Kaarinaea lacus]
HQIFPLTLIEQFYQIVNRLFQITVLYLLLLLMAGELFAEDKIVTGKFVVSLTAEGKQKVWVVNALEQNIYNDISGYEKVVPVKKDIANEKTCKKRHVDCIVEVYKNLGVDALMLGTVDESDIDYEIYDVQNRFLVKTGSIDIGSGSSLLKLRMGAFSAFKPFLEKGGILDKRKYFAVTESEIDGETAQKVQPGSDTRFQKAFLIFLALFSAFPYLFSLFGKPRKHPERVKIILRWFYPFLIVCLSVIAYQWILIERGAGNIPNILFNQTVDYHWLLTGLGGMLWGYFIIINFKIIFPHLQGIERIQPNNLIPLLQSCLVTIVIKSLIMVAVFSGVFAAVFYAGKLFSVNQEIMVLVLFPLSGLYFSYWVALMLDVFSMSIDINLSDGDLDIDSIWNLKTRNYFIGYLKRNGVTLNKRLIDKTVFVAADNEGAMCYGGGFNRPRITIDRGLMKFSLGDIDDFNPMDTAIFTKKVTEPVKRQNTVFQLFANLSPDMADTKVSRSRHVKNKIKNIERAQKHYERDLGLPVSIRKSPPEDILQGIVYPHLDGADNFPSLMSNNADDMRIVEALLLDGSLRAHPYDEDAEIDDSSEQDKDFLFGTLLHKFGALIRREEIFSTLYLYFFYKPEEKRKPYNFLFSRYFAIVADTFVVLNFGLNHLIQHLYYQVSDDPSFLTTKGIISGMLKSQDEILTRAKQLVDERETTSIQTDELDRLIWLSRFSQDPIEHQMHTSIVAERIVKWSVSLGVMYFVIMAVVNSYNYHPEYLATIAQEKQKIAEAIEAEKERERNEL